MKTTVKPLFTMLHDKHLASILSQLVQQYSIIQLFYTQEPAPIPSQLIIHIEKILDEKKLMQSLWIKQLIKKRNLIRVHYIDTKSLEQQCTVGHPFIELYCQPSALLYKKMDMETATAQQKTWDQYKQLFSIHLDHFLQDRNALKNQIKLLMIEGSSISVFESLEKLVEYDIAYLEELYTGKKFNFMSLHQRILNLISYNPAIQKYFVKSSANKYYIIDLFELVKKIAKEYDEVFREEAHIAITIAEEGLHSIIEERLEELNRKIKILLERKNSSNQTLSIQSEESILDIALYAILKRIEAEQIFLFEKEIYNEKQTYYLLLIGEGASNTRLKQISEILNQIDPERNNFVLIGHSRSWIQKHLYEYQSFFKKNTQREMLIYSSNEFHPSFHWLVPYDLSHDGLLRLYKCSEQSALQFHNLADRDTENYLGLDTQFALFFLCFCRTFIYLKTYYLPNYLSSECLWKLCCYADPDIRKYEYFIKQFWTNFFFYVDKHRNIMQDIVELDRVQIAQMRTITEKLSSELHKQMQSQTYNPMN